MSLLDLTNVHKHFGGLEVVHNLSLAVNAGEIVSLIGPNGAGKTTVFNLISGLYRPERGDIRFNGQSLLGLEPHAITWCGIARTFHTLRLYAHSREPRPNRLPHPGLSPRRSAHSPDGRRETRLLRRKAQRLPPRP